MLFGHSFKHKIWFFFIQWIIHFSQMTFALSFSRNQITFNKTSKIFNEIFSKSKLLLLYCNMASKNTCCYNEWRILPQGMKVLVIFKKRSYSDLHYFNPQGQSKFCFPIRKKWRKPYTIIMPGYVIVYELETISCL